MASFMEPTTQVHDTIPTLSSGSSPPSPTPNPVDDGDRNEERRFPPEIEYEILTLAFHNHPKSKIDLLTVCKRAHEWLIPVLYKAVLISDVPKEPTYPSLRILQRYGHHIQRLFVYISKRAPFDPQITGATLLAACPNVSDLVLWGAIHVTRQVLNLPIKRLLVQREDFIGRRKTPQIQNWHCNITHIVFGGIPQDTLPDFLSQFPSLTHVMTFVTADVNTIRSILNSCAKLEVFIWMLGRCGLEDPTRLVTGDDACTVDDSRVVTLNGAFVSDWRRSTNGEDDAWVLAEREIEERKKRQDSSYVAV